MVRLIGGDGYRSRLCRDEQHGMSVSLQSSACSKSPKAGGGPSCGLCSSSLRSEMLNATLDAPPFSRITLTILSP